MFRDEATRAEWYENVLFFSCLDGCRSQLKAQRWMYILVPSLSAALVFLLLICCLVCKGCPLARYNLCNYYLQLGQSQISTRTWIYSPYSIFLCLLLKVTEHSSLMAAGALSQTCNTNLCRLNLSLLCGHGVQNKDQVRKRFLTNVIWQTMNGIFYTKTIFTCIRDLKNVR